MTYRRKNSATHCRKTILSHGNIRDIASQMATQLSQDIITSPTQLQNCTLAFDQRRRPRLEFRPITLCLHTLQIHRLRSRTGHLSQIALRQRPSQSIRTTRRRLRHGHRRQEAMLTLGTLRRHSCAELRLRPSPHSLLRVERRQIAGQSPCPFSSPISNKPDGEAEGKC